jgi:hypothetical protein
MLKILGVLFLILVGAVSSPVEADIYRDQFPVD